MASLLKHRAIGCFVLTLAAAPAPALAESPSSEASVEARRDEAKAKFQRGSELYEAGQYQDAVHAFMAADRLAASAALSFNIARAYERLNDTSGALRWYRDYLRRSPNAKNAAEVRDKVAALSSTLSRSGLQQLTALSMPVGAVVVIDGRAVGVTPFTADLALGKHRVLLTLPGYRDATHDLQLAADGPREISATLQQAPGPAAASPAPGQARPGPEPERRFGIVPWLIAGAGVASLGGGLAFELVRRSHEKSARAAPDQPTFKVETDAMERDKTTARVLAGIGGALVVTGSTLLLFNQRPSAANAQRIGLACTFTGCMASARGAF